MMMLITYEQPNATFLRYWIHRG